MSVGQSPSVSHAGSVGDEAEIERRREQVELKILAHWSYRQIASELNVSKTTVGLDVAAIRERWRERSAESHAALVAQELAVLEALRGPMITIALNGKNSPLERAAAAREARRLSESTWRLLGLDRLQRLEVGTSAVVSTLDDELARLVDLLVQQPAIDVRSVSHNASQRRES